MPEVFKDQKGSQSVWTGTTCGREDMSGLEVIVRTLAFALSEMGAITEFGAEK